MNYCPPPAAPVSPAAADALSLPPARTRLLGFRRARRFFRSLQSRWIIVLWTVNEKEGRKIGGRGRRRQLFQLPSSSPCLTLGKEGYGYVMCAPVSSRHPLYDTEERG